MCCGVGGRWPPMATLPPVRKRSRFHARVRAVVSCSRKRSLRMTLDKLLFTLKGNLGLCITAVIVALHGLGRCGATTSSASAMTSRSSVGGWPAPSSGCPAPGTSSCQPLRPPTSVASDRASKSSMAAGAKDMCVPTTLRGTSGQHKLGENMLLGADPDVYAARYMCAHVSQPIPRITPSQP